MRSKKTRFFSPLLPRSGRRAFLCWSLLLAFLAALLAANPLYAARTPNKRLHVPVTIIPGLTAEIRSLRFYPTDYGQQDFRRRKYEKTFEAPRIKYLNWELILDHPFERDHALRFPIEAVLTGPGGKVVDRSAALAWIEPDSNWTQWGKAFRVSTWKPGTYKVAIYIGGKELLKSSFQIVGAKTAPVVTSDPLAALLPLVKSLRFYAGGLKSTPYYQAKFATEFQSQNTREIWWILDLVFLGRRSGPVTLPVEETWFGPGNQIIHQVSRKFTVPQGKTAWWFGARYGFKEPGKWAPGTYRVVLKVKDKVLSSASFKMEGKGAAPAPTAGNFLTQHHLKFVSLKFFEGPEQTPKYKSRIYGVQFPQSTTRHIFWELDVDSLVPQTATVPFTIKTFWYDPAGKLIRESTANFRLTPDTKRPWYAQGYGYKTPGYWKPGKYQAVLKINNQEIASGYFEITAAKRAPVTSDFLRQHDLKFVSLRFFAGPANPPQYGARDYKEKFPQASRYIYYELILDASGRRTAAVPFVLEASLYGPEGFVLRRTSVDFVLRQDYKRPAFAAAFDGDELPGRWQPGQYRMVLKIKGQEVAAGSFEITSAFPFPLKK